MEITPHPDDKVFDKETPFNEMEVYFIKSAYIQVKHFADECWKQPDLKPYAEQFLENIQNEIDKGLIKPVKGVKVRLFIRYFMEYGLPELQARYITLAFYLTFLIEGHKRIIHEDNFHIKLLQFNIATPPSAYI